MTIYRLELYCHYEGSSGYEFFSNKLNALKRLAEWKAEAEEACTNLDLRLDRITFKPTVKGVLDMMTQFASHNDNG